MKASYSCYTVLGQPSQRNRRAVVNPVRVLAQQPEGHHPISHHRIRNGAQRAFAIRKYLAILKVNQESPYHFKIKYLLYNPMTKVYFRLNILYGNYPITSFLFLSAAFVINLKLDPVSMDSAKYN